MAVKGGLRSNPDLEIAQPPKYLSDSKHRVDIGEASTVARESYRERVHRLDFQSLADSVKSSQAAKLEEEIKMLYREKLAEHREKFGYEITPENQQALSEALGIDLELPVVTEQE